MIALKQQLSLDGRLWNIDSDHRFTPKSIVSLIKKVLGTIDLDPCTIESNPVGANMILTEEEDALTFEWIFARNIYLNPPSSNQDKFLEYLVTGFLDIDSSNEFAIVSIQYNTNYPFPKELKHASLLCFPFKKIEWIFDSKNKFTEDLTVFALFSRYQLFLEKIDADYYCKISNDKLKNRKAKFCQNFSKIGLVVAPQED